MIFILSMSRKEWSLHELEFVRPVEKIVEGLGIPFTTGNISSPVEGLAGASGLILCGGGLGDNAALDNIERLGWIRDFHGPVLGIGTGANLLSLLHGGGVEECLEIGMVQLDVTLQDDVLGDIPSKEVYVMHKYAPVPPGCFEVLARRRGCVYAFRDARRRAYGVLFRPEVRHPSVVEIFCSICIDVEDSDS